MNTGPGMPQTITAGDENWSAENAYGYCERLARTHYENFTVGSMLMPRKLRRHMYALYAYCRTVDDLGDEALPPPPGAGLAEEPSIQPEPADDPGAYRLSLLDWWESQLQACYGGEPSHPVMVALQETIGAFGLPQEPFLKLIEANRMDQLHRRYPTYAGLLRYCDHSANPVGRLVLGLFGYGDPERQRLSDATCTALQLANFWQDVARDYAKGRVYLPLEDLDAFGYSEAELAGGVEDEAFRRLMAFEVDRAMQLFREGAPLAASLTGPARLDVALFTRGGVAALEAIRRQDCRVLHQRPALSRRRKAGLFLSTWLSAKLGLGMGLPNGKSREVRN